MGRPGKPTVVRNKPGLIGASLPPMRESSYIVFTRQLKIDRVVERMQKITLDWVVGAHCETSTNVIVDYRNSQTEKCPAIAIAPATAGARYKVM